MQRPVGWYTDSPKKASPGKCSLLPKGEQSKLSTWSQCSQEWKGLFPVTETQIKTVLHLLPFPSHLITQHDLSIDNFPLVPTEYPSQNDW